MALQFPETSVTLLADIGSNAQAARWHEFVQAYSPALRDYARRNFPHLEADDLLQETFVALIKRLPDYVYSPESKGAFHNYLVGMLRIIALDTLRKNAREASHVQDAAEDVLHPFPTLESWGLWQKSAYEIALRQFLADPRVHGQTKEIFSRVALKGESPETVANDYGIDRNTVDQIKDRTLRRLRALVQNLSPNEDGLRPPSA